MGLQDDLRAAVRAAEKQWTLGEIAKRAKIHPVNLRQFASGSRTLSLESLERLAAALGVAIVVTSKTSK